MAGVSPPRDAQIGTRQAHRGEVDIGAEAAEKRLRDGEAAEGCVAVLVVVAGRLAVFHRDAEFISQAPRGEAADIGVGKVANVAGEESGLDETVRGLGP